MRSRQLGMSPAKIAIAVAVTIEAIAGTGSIKKVTGTRSAVAMVAVSPGTAPTKRPNAAEARITHSTYGSSTSRSASKSIALEETPGQRNAQELVEREMDRDAGHDRDHAGGAPRRTENPRPQREQHDAGDVEAERVGGGDVEDEAAEHGCHAHGRPAAGHPVGPREPASATPGALVDESEAASSESRADQAGEPRR